MKLRARSIRESRAAWLEIAARTSKVLFHFVAGHLGELTPNALTRHVAGELVEVQCDLESLFARHRSVTLDLSFKSGFGSHGCGPFGHPEVALCVGQLALSSWGRRKPD